MSNRGSAMVLVVVLILVGGIFFSITLSYHRHIWLSVLHKTQAKQATWLAESGIKRIEFFLNGGDGKDLSWECDSFTEPIPGYGTIELSNKQWGLYSFASATGSRIKEKRSMEALLFRTRPIELEPVITLTGHIGGMVIDNETNIDGTVVLHHGDIKRGKYKRTIPGAESWTVRKEMPALPFEKSEYLKRVQAIAEPLSKVSLGSDLDSILFPMNGDTVSISGTAFLTKGLYKNCLIVASKGVQLEKGVELQASQIISGDSLHCTGTSSNALFYSTGPMKISGTHESQFFSQTAITVEEGNYKELSLFSVIEQSRDTTLDTVPLFSVETDKEFQGTIITITDTSSVRDAVTFTDKTTFSGQVITNGSVRIKECTFTGALWCHSVLSDVDNVMYKNWLWKSSFTKGKATAAFPLIGSKPITVLHREQS